MRLSTASPLANDAEEHNVELSGVGIEVASLTAFEGLVHEMICLARHQCQVCLGVLQCRLWIWDEENQDDRQNARSCKEEVEVLPVAAESFEDVRAQDRAHPATTERHRGTCRCHDWRVDLHDEQEGRQHSETETHDLQVEGHLVEDQRPAGLLLRIHRLAVDDEHHQTHGNNGQAGHQRHGTTQEHSREQHEGPQDDSHAILHEELLPRRHAPLLQRGEDHRLRIGGAILNKVDGEGHDHEGHGGVAEMSSEYHLEGHQPGLIRPFARSNRAEPSFYRNWSVVQGGLVPAI
mmetsp:Transcript_17906/g.39332  ORF Transcript_17906/g.39332 Transcript_17906/m.39332 type:complete len:292 (+) Transcript_17906:72-947(+)